MVIARPITGEFRTLKNRIRWALFAVFFGLPFLQIGGNPAILLDIPARKFHIFGLTIWPQELYFLQMLLLGLGITLFFVTSLKGRIWCAYACPQTIFIELYDMAGRLLAGKKYGKKTATALSRIPVYTGWIILSLLIGFVFIAYFKGARPMISSLLSSGWKAPGTDRIATWVIFWGAASFFSFVAFAWFRENACKYVCPYGRFQTALLDRHSPIIAYDSRRGEPRREKGSRSGGGDCTACNLCVLSCPTGIDIRNGLQVGCIRCGLCVDACTIEMGRFGKETLIDLKTQAQVEGGKSVRIPYLRSRTIVYGSLLAAILITFTVVLSLRIPFYITVLKDKTIPDIFIPGIGWQNGFEMHIGNKSDAAQDLEIRIADGNYSIVNEDHKVHLDPAQFRKIRLLVRAKEKPAGSPIRPLVFQILQAKDGTLVKKSDSLFRFAEAAP